MGQQTQEIRLGLEQEKPYLNFINSLRSKATIKAYRLTINHYMQFQRVSNISSLLKQDNKAIEQQIISYLVDMRLNQKLSYSILALRLAAVKKFYEMNDVIINWKKVSNYLGENTKLFKDRAYTTEEIQQVLTKADERMRVVILLLASTGMRIGAIPDLKLKHLIKIDNYDLYQLSVYERTKDEYYCFCSPECASAIDSYIAYRKRCYEKIDSESPMIREQFDRDNPDKARNPRHLPLNTLNALIRDLLISGGIRPIEHPAEAQSSGRLRKEVKASHGFRKFATTNMIRAKVNPEAREMLLGHSIGLSDSYYRPDSNEILTEYLKAVDLLTINEENRLRRKVETLEVKADKIVELQQTIDDVKRKLGLM
jgi:integrase